MSDSKAIDLRRVQVAGGSTFTVSLPKAWAVGHGISNGSVLAVRQAEDGSLVVSPAHVGVSQQPPAIVESSRLHGDALLRRLIAHYLVGHDTVLVRATPRLSLQQRETVRRFTQMCVGPEIVEETGDQILVRDLVTAAEFGLSQALNRVHLIARSMITDALAALDAHDLDVARDVVSRDEEVDRLHRLVAKRLSRMLAGGAAARDPGVTLAEAQRIHQVSRLLERCADHAANVVRPTIATAPRRQAS